MTTETIAKQDAQGCFEQASNARRMVFDTEEGEATFTYPGNLSEESVADLEEWFALVTKRLRRATKH